MNNTFTAPSGKTFSGWNTASDGSGTSYAPGDNFNITANTTLYAQWVISVCTPTWSSSDYGYISNFTVTSSGSTLLNSSSTGTTNSNTDYYNSRSFTVAAGSEISCSITPSGSSTYGFAIWMDLNNNGLDSGDRVLYTSSYSSSFSNQTYTIPANTSPGEYRVRILQDWSTKTPSDPCGSYNYGEAEDYKLIVTAPLATHTITANIWPSAGGTVSGNTTVTHGGNTTLTATANSGYQFVNWTDSDGDVVSSSATLSFTNVTSDATYQANFTSTSATALPWSENFDSYTNVTSSNWGYLNGEWATPLRDNKAPCVTYYGAAATSGYRSLELRADNSTNMVVLPQFNQALNTLLISFQIGRGNSSSGYTVELGYVTNPSDASTFTALTTVPIPSSAVGSHTQFSYNLATNNNTPSNTNYRLAIRYTMTGSDSWYLDDFSVSVPTYTVTTTVSPSGAGSVSGLASGGTYTNGSTCSLTATPTANSGYTFTNWTENNTEVSSNATYSFTVTDNHNLTANFTLSSYSITVTANPTAGGTVSGGGTYSHGASVTLSATANTGYNFVNWTENGTVVSTSANYTFTATAAGDYVANFVESCPRPTGLVASANNNSITVTWNGGSASSWQVYVSSSNSAPSASTSGTPASTNSYTVGSLSVGETRYFWVRTDCGSNEYSAWEGPVDATTHCTAPGNTLSATATSTGAVLTWTGGTGEEYIVEFGTPVTIQDTLLNEGFESGIPSTWSQVQGSGTSSWTTGAGTAHTLSNAATGSSNAKFSASSTGPNTYLILPALDLSGALSATLTFNYANPYYSSTYPDDIDEIGVYYRVNSGTWNELMYETAEHRSWTSKSITLTGLAANYEIAFYAKSNWGGGIGVDDVKVVANVASINWTEVANDATSPYTITGCNIGTTYKARVKDQCDNVSNEVDFTPDCTSPTNLVAHPSSSGAVLTWDGGTDEEYTVQYRTYVPAYSTLLSEDFESMSLSTSYSSSGWYAYNAGSGNNWSLDDDSDYSYSGTHYILYPYNSSYAANCYLVSPPFAVSSNMTNLTVSLYERVDSSYPEQFEVFFVKASDVTTLSGVASVTHYSAIASTTYSNNSYTQITGSNSAAALAGTNVRVVVHCTSAADMDFVAIDDIEVTSQSGTFGSWTTITGTHEPPYNLTGLTTGTTYQAQVIDQCGNESNIVTFTPACGAPLNVAATPSNSSAEITWVGGESSYNVRDRETEVLFEEGVEDGIPSTWTIIDNDGDGYGWQIMGGTIHGGSGAVASASFINNVGALTPDNWLITPLINLRGTLEVWLSGYDANDYAEHFAIYLSTTGNSVSDFTTILVSETTTINGYLNYTANLDLYTGQQGYIAIRHFNCTNMYWLYVDDFGIYDSWQTASSNASSPYTLNGLTPNTDYEVQVQSTCGGDWVGTTFTTLPGYTITAVADPTGSGTFAFTGDDVISSTTTTAQVSPNGNVTVTATASTGYTFMNWIENGSVVSQNNPYSLSNVNDNHTLTAHFVQQNTPDTWVTAVTSEPSGYSVDGSTITISNANGLAWLISTVNGLNGQSGTAITSSTVINLTADVDMSAHIWVPIGTTEHPFVGTFNGNGHTISRITRSLEFPNQGVFGYVSGGTIHDVVVNTNITGDCNYMGSVAGTLASGTVYNTGSTGTVTANTNTIAVGGTVGYNGGLVHSSFATGIFTGLAGDYVGGLVGENAPAGCLYNSYSNDTLKGGNRGGLVGYNYGTVANCYNVNNSATYAYVNTNAGTMEYVYTDNSNNGFYYSIVSGSSSLSHHGDHFSAVQSNIKHLDYMYRDNAITLYSGQTNSYIPSSVSYANGHTIKWNGLVSALNQWVEANKTSGVNISTLSSWYRPLTTAINGDLPVLGFSGETTLGAADGSPKALQYGTMDELLTAYNNSTASVFHYGKATGVTHVPTANVNVFINEDAVLLQATSPDPGAFINTTVGVTFDNSDHGTHAYDYWGNKLDYDWHFMSTPLSNAKIGATYNDYVAHGYGSDIDIKSLVDSYFPNGLPMTLHDANWKWDFYTYYEPEYHWINMKRNKNNHYHVDGGWSISYTYIADDQAIGDEASRACVFIPGKGYMMAISKDAFMNSTGTLNRGNVPIRLTLKEPDDINYASGWNLVGNPYQAYLNINALNRDLYIYDADQGVYAPYAPAASGNPATPSQYIHPHQAFFVHAASDGEELIFTQTMASTETTPYSYYRDDRIDYPLVNLYAENNAGQRDLTVIEFHRPELGGARKLETMRNAPFTLAAHYAGMNYGILFATDDMERIPVRFKTDESGLVTLTWSTYNGEFRKLLLIDNKLGVEHNMLADHSYTFEASPDDYSSRFYIVYDCSGMGIEENGPSTGSGTDSGTFAYINNGNIVIDVGTSHGASLQVIDVLGRVLYSKVIAGTEGTYTVSTRGLAKGVYLIRLADGHNVKTQKLVVQ